MSLFFQDGGGRSVKIISFDRKRVGVYYTASVTDFCTLTRN